MSKSIFEGVRSVILPRGELRVLFGLSVAWLALDVAGIFAHGFAALDAAWTAGLILKLLLAAGVCLSVRTYLLGDLVKGYRGYKAFLGYGTFFSYIAQALAPYSWRELSLIGPGRAAWSWAFSLAAAAPALALYVLVSTNAWRVKLGVMAKKDAAAKLRYKPPKPATLAGKVLDNVDAVVQAVIMVAVIHALLFQLYVIPTESMVPRFLVNDRVIVTKLQSGPRLPLSPVKLPSLYRPKRGDIIVYDNPFSPKPNALRRMVNTVAFYLSFSTLNLDKDAYGQPRVGTVVKRLVGMPGDKLMMVDDVLYRKAAGGAWEPLAQDEAWSHADLYAERQSVRDKIREFPISESLRKEFDAIDAMKDGKGLESFAAELEASRAPFARLSSAGFLSGLSAEGRAYLKDAERSSWGLLDAEARRDGLSSLFGVHSLVMKDDVGLFLYALSDQARLDAFNAFLTLPDYPQGMNAFELSAAKLNAHIKTLQAKRWAVYLGLASKGDFKSLSRIASTQAGEGLVDMGTLSDQGEAFTQWGLAYRYMYYFDSRNFAEFPSGEGYIPKGRYFLMGDNRYNSLDFRYNHDYRYEYLALDARDPASVKRSSNIEMNTLAEGNILGKVLITFWPPGAAGR